MEYIINFSNENLTVKVKEGTLLSKAFEEAGIFLNLVCGGKGTCGKCKVKISRNNKVEEVLACKTPVMENITVITDGYDSMDVPILTSKIENYQFNPHVRKFYLEKNDLEKRKNELLKGCDPYLLKKFYRLYNNNVQGMTFVKYEDSIIDVLPGDSSKVLYGAAVDIGTTTVVIYIYDLITGKLLSTLSDVNSQVAMGADLVTRINYGKTEEGLKELNKKIISTLNKLLESAKEQLPDLPENLYHIVLCGNTLMHHLFLGLSPEGLGRSPFEGITKDLVECWGSETEIICTERCKIEFLPLLGGFVGADMVALLLTIEEESKNMLIVDLGTNGEIAVGNIKGYYVTSAACGPALEGGNITCGMRAASGAIERCKIEGNQVILKVVGSQEPTGICGSGIIDIVAELLRNNILDKTGRIRSYDEFSGINPYSKLKDRIEEIDGNNSFVIYKPNNLYQDGVYVIQKDIRQVQLSKSSIYSAIMTILGIWGKSMDDIDEVIVSGAFGNYINPHNAQYIGLLPKTRVEIKIVGNGAGKGVSLYLLNKYMKEKLNKIIENTTHVQLGENDLFADNYINNMNFYT